MFFLDEESGKVYPSINRFIKIWSQYQAIINFANYEKSEAGDEQAKANHVIDKITPGLLRSSLLKVRVTINDILLEQLTNSHPENQFNQLTELISAINSQLDSKKLRNELKDFFKEFSGLRDADFAEGNLGLVEYRENDFDTLPILHIYLLLLRLFNVIISMEMLRYTKHTGANPLNGYHSTAIEDALTKIIKGG